MGLKLEGIFLFVSLVSSFFTWNHSCCQLLHLVDGKEWAISGVYNATQSLMQLILIFVFPCLCRGFSPCVHGRAGGAGRVFLTCPTLALEPTGVKKWRQYWMWLHTQSELTAGGRKKAFVGTT